MQKKLKEAYHLEMDEAIRFYELSQLDCAFHHLERAHILAQRYIIPHTRCHWWMLKVGVKKRSLREVFGQLTRIIASVLFSRIWVPVGNTGGANVNPLKIMPIPEDLKKILSK
ncbi:DUF3703 domain-containing protein [Shewanella electrodiphila]|uniref:DUF3703 domain-containing protein n=1 Tax=Shewanella electrodiphila TaxID=934143 RepID=A0ABT0KNW6_9GAMM|nr:DUF3703 domain-containing protein [Shewanella electrodiphila]MCL1045531.1 DUF3703 domain-containing protein [Shewanella electrodiphila]